MSFAPLFAAPLLIQIHAFAALAAFGLGLWQFAAPKGTVPHRILGWVWAGLMLMVALTSFGITGHSSAGGLSWVHGMSMLLLVILPLAIGHARRGRVVAHRITMLSLFFGALVITGGFTLMPGRIMHRVAFGG